MGICASPKELRACLPLPRNTSWRSSDAPFATKCCSAKFGAEFTQTKHLDDALQLFQILQFVVNSCQQINRCTASRLLSFFAGEVNAQFPRPRFPIALCDVPRNEQQIPSSHAGDKGRNRGFGNRQSDLQFL
jgi:hypothetical protein